MKKEIYTTIGIIAIILVLIVNIVLAFKIVEYKGLIKYQVSNFTSNTNFTKKIELNKKDCPDAIGGNPNAYLKMKYFYTPFCPWCRKEEPILRELLAEKGLLFSLGWYDLRYCSEEVEKYKVSGVPTFVFSTYNSTKEYTHYGFIYKEDLNKLICNVTGGC